MQIFNIEQGTDEWHKARRGVITGSRFKDIVTPAKGDLSSSSKKYMYELVAERMGATIENFSNEYMQRGTELEADARSAYEFIKDATVDEVGFCLEGIIGVSPDGLINDDGGLEIKCPKETTHISYLDDGGLPLIYKPQVQGSLWITGREWWDFMSYHPQLPPLIIRVYRDEDYIKNMEKVITKFAEDMLELEQKLRDKYENRT